MRLHIIIYTAIAAAFLSCSSSARNADNGDGAAQTEVTSAKPTIFDADSAYAYVARQVSFGPRVPESAAHGECADWLAETLRKAGGQVYDKTVTVPHPVEKRDIKLRNVFARFNESATNRILIMAHYDTRPWADADADPTNRNTPIDGANDGASGVGVALEIARNAHLLDPKTGLDVLLVDWEDSGSEGKDESWCIGSSYFADNLPYNPGNMPRYAVLLDMVGGHGAIFKKEYFSELYASDINTRIWQAANQLGYGTRFIDDIGGAINDDHVPLLRVGIPAVDIIETGPNGFNPTWHTLNDNIENIDKSTLKVVGDVVTDIIFKNHDN